MSDCFGCGQHGDVITFAMETEGLSFPEAIERLAGQAGLEVPQSSPQERERARLRALKKEMGQDELAQQLLRVWGAEVELAISLKVAGAEAPGLVML